MPATFQTQRNIVNFHFSRWWLQTPRLRGIAKVLHKEVCILKMPPERERREWGGQGDSLVRQNWAVWGKCVLWRVILDAAAGGHQGCKVRREGSPWNGPSWARYCVGKRANPSGSLWEQRKSPSSCWLIPEARKLEEFAHLPFVLGWELQAGNELLGPPCLPPHGQQRVRGLWGQSLRQVQNVVCWGYTTSGGLDEIPLATFKRLTKTDYPSPSCNHGIIL